MPWVESASASFRARHDAAHTEGAQQVLQSLEVTREYLREWFAEDAGEVTVVLHEGLFSLTLARPLLPFAWLLTAPAARRYLAGWGSRGEVHALTPAALRERASGTPESLQMLSRSAASAYARLVIAANNRDLSRVGGPVRLHRITRWAWMLEGASRWFSGQMEYARPAIGRRLREGDPPSFPPSVRDALLLGGTVIDLLVREEGESAAVRFVSRLDPEGPRAALASAFGGRPLIHTEGAWRSHLARIAGAG